MHACDFSYLHYIETLTEIKKTHNFTNFINSSSNDIILRHDVDSSLELALKIAKIENNLGISSTFFILFHSELYNPFNPSSSKIISQILRLGHEIGVHYNGSLISKIKKNLSDIIKNEIETLEEHFETSVSVISAHNPGISKKLEIVLPNGVVDAYSEKYTVQRKYLSDSVQYWREGCFCKHYKNYDSMQVLTHPIWWTNENKGRKEIMKSFLDWEWDKFKLQVEKNIEQNKKYIEKISSKKVD